MEETGSKGGRTRRPAAKAPVAAASRVAATKPTAAKAVAPKKSPAPKKPATAPAAVPPGADGPDRDQLVRLAAYFRAERRGFAPGNDVDDWLAAEAEVAAQFSERVPATPRKPARKPAGG